MEVMTSAQAFHSVWTVVNTKVLLVETFLESLQPHSLLPQGLQSLEQRAALRTTSYLKPLSREPGDECGGLRFNSCPSNSFSGEGSDACADLS